VENYFRKNIDTCPNSIRVLNKYNRWTPAELEHNHTTVLARLRGHYAIPTD